MSDIHARSVLLQFTPGSDGKTSITQWIVEAREVEESTEYTEIYQVNVVLFLFFSSPVQMYRKSYCTTPGGGGGGSGGMEKM